MAAVMSSVHRPGCTFAKLLRQQRKRYDGFQRHHFSDPLEITEKSAHGAAVFDDSLILDRLQVPFSRGDMLAANDVAKYLQFDPGQSASTLGGAN